METVYAKSENRCVAGSNVKLDWTVLVSYNFAF